jgi:predicted nucleic acid-binding protein
MSSGPKDIVIDTNVIRLYDEPGDPIFKALFAWLGQHGTLVVSQKLVTEYGGTGNELLAGLIGQLMKTKRFIRVQTSELKAFKADAHYNYLCNKKDVWHARLVFVSRRKLLVSLDNNLVDDVNGFQKISGIKPRATRRPNREFYA